MTEHLTAENRNVHTPGPWTLTHIAGRNFAIQMFEIRGMFADTPNVYPIFQKSLDAIDGAKVFLSPENARLIALSPEMLELLVEYTYDGNLQSFEDRERFRSKARALIAKAVQS